MLCSFKWLTWVWLTLFLTDFGFFYKQYDFRSGKEFIENRAVVINTQQRNGEGRQWNLKDENTAHMFYIRNLAVTIAREQMNEAVELW